MAIRFLRGAEVFPRRGRSRSSTYADVRRGVFPPPVALGPRASGWPEYEVEIVNAAVLAGKTTFELRELVRRLVTQREAALTTVGAPAGPLELALSRMASRAPDKAAGHLDQALEQHPGSPRSSGERIAVHRDSALDDGAIDFPARDQVTDATRNQRPSPFPKPQQRRKRKSD